MFKETSVRTLRDGCDTREDCYRTGTPVTSGRRGAHGYTQVSSHIRCCQSVSGIGVPV
jgi:hypothetical protein